jgi:hypothetical protein
MADGERVVRLDSSIEREKRKVTPWVVHATCAAVVVVLVWSCFRRRFQTDTVGRFLDDLVTDDNEEFLFGQNLSRIAMRESNYRVTIKTCGIESLNGQRRSFSARRFRAPLQELRRRRQNPLRRNPRRPSALLAFSQIFGSRPFGMQPSRE